MSERTLIEQVKAWVDDEVDSAAADELSALLADADHDESARAELAERFAGPLTFGTAGLRGPMRAGPNGMNRVVVRRAASGLVAWLRETHPGGVVVIGFDARHHSRDFAEDSAGIFAAAGFDARLLPGPLPTPVLAFAVKHLDAVAGVMVTASHNPAQDNGYKVYGGDGAQIVSPSDVEIEAAIAAVGVTRSIPMSADFVRVDDALVADYVRAISALVRPPAAELRIVHTAMHGVGTSVVRRVFAAAGYPQPASVDAQADPDPDFPTVAFPNPEEHGALDLALSAARSHNADLVIASDPDADRCAAAVEFPSEGWRMLTGNELGWLLADALISKGIQGTFATTIVSSSLLGAMARNCHRPYGETLTGFKWITRAADDLAFGYEEALGYAVAPNLVRDKDGISAALVLAEYAATLKATGSSLPQRLDELAAEYGRHTTDQISVRVEDLSQISDTMARLRREPPAELLGQTVTCEDLAPRADVLRLTWPAGRVVVRPSGTEPKLKAYLELVTDGTAAEAAEQMRALRTELSSLLDA